MVTHCQISKTRKTLTYLRVQINTMHSSTTQRRIKISKILSHLRYVTSFLRFSLNQMIYYQQQLMQQQHGANPPLMNLPNVQQFFGSQNALLGLNNGAFQFGGFGGQVSFIKLFTSFARLS